MNLRFRGVANIVRFNWHFYVIAMVFVLVAVGAALMLSGFWSVLAWLAAVAAVLTTLMSLLVSWHVYDLSGMDRFGWLQLPEHPDSRVVQLHAGFDESREALAAAVAHSEYRVFDFYDPRKHTEVSIERARRAYPPEPGTVTVDTAKLPLEEGSVDLAALVFAAHEIREEGERIHLFRQLAESLADDGRILVVEHLRDWRNFLAFNFGFLHFHSDRTWRRTFESGGLTVESRLRPHFFVTAYLLKK